MADYITKSTVLSRDGWTEKAITLFAPVCNKEVSNPHSKKAASMKLYTLSRIEEIEKSDYFKSFVENNANKRKGAKKLPRPK